MRWLFLLLVLALSQPFAQGQDFGVSDCGTGEVPADVAQWLMSLDHSAPKSENTDTTWLGIQIHLVHAPGGPFGIRLDSLMRSMEVLNRRFAPARMQFYLASKPNVIINSVWASPPSSQAAASMMDSFNRIRVVNVYFTNLASQGLCGYAYFPGSGPGGVISRGGAMMSYSCSSPNFGTLAHELGHYFSLPHPFQSTSNDPQSAVAERVTRNFNEVVPRLPANCYTTGDYFCDTKADPYGSRWNCVSNPATFDLNGDRFFADSSLVMSYAANSCRDIFSEEQNTAMRATIETNASPRGYLTFLPRPQPAAIVSQPTLELPANGATGLHPNFLHFHWTAVQGASWYHVRIKRTISAALARDTLVQGTSMSILDNKLFPNMDYEWSVQAVNENDFSPKNVVWHSFSTGLRTATSVANFSETSTRFYPNPIQRGGQLHVSQTTLSTATLTLRNLQGQVVLQHELAAGLQKIELPASIAAGTYILQFSNPKGQHSSHRLVVLP